MKAGGRGIGLVGIRFRIALPRCPSTSPKRRLRGRLHQTEDVMQGNCKPAVGPLFSVQRQKKASP